MTAITTALAELLSTVRRPGDFYFSGSVEFLAPRIEVDGVGPIALPLLPVQAEQLVAAAERPTRNWHAQRGSEPGEMARMLSLLAVLADKDRKRLPTTTACFA